MEDVQEVEAEVIDIDIEPLSKAGQWLASTREFVDRMAAEYGRSVTVTTKPEHDQLKREREALNREMRRIDTERKDMTGSIDDFLKGFRGTVKDMLSSLVEARDGIDAAVKAYEARVIEERMDMLRDAYESSVPYIAVPQGGNSEPAVPFDRVVEAFGKGATGKKWMLYGTKDGDALEGLRKAIETIADCEQDIVDTVAEDSRDEVRAAYFATLDLHRAIAEVNDRRRQREALAALEAEREAERQWAEEQAAEAEYVPVEAEEPVEPQVVEPQVVEEQVAPEPPAPVPEVPAATDRWVIVGYCNREQAMLFERFCRENGIGRFRAADTHGYEYKLARV